MPAYAYTAKTPLGDTVQGTVVAESLGLATSRLLGDGLEVLNIGVQAEAPRAEVPRTEIPRTPPPPTDPRSYAEANVWGPLVGTVPLKGLSFFLRQFATMMKAGVPIVQSLHTLASQTQHPKLRRVVAEIAGHVEAGRPPSVGMERYPEVFNPVITSLIRAGEQGGFPERALEEAADYVDREIELRNLYRRLTFYPKLQIALSILIILATNFILGAIGSGSRLSSPLTEPATWVCLGPLIAAMFLFFRVGTKNPSVRRFYDRAILKIPYVGETARQMSMAKFGRAFGALYRGGLPIPQCLQMGADACGNLELRERMLTAARRLEGGDGIATTFAATGAFSPIVLDMVATGETTGNLDQMLNRLADFYEDEATTRSHQTAQIVGVALGLAVAVYIGYIVIKFYMGYFSGIMQAV